MTKYPFIIKNNKNEYFVFYAEGTKAKQFNNYQEAIKFKKSI